MLVARVTQTICADRVTEQRANAYRHENSSSKRNGSQASARGSYAAWRFGALMKQRKTVSLQPTLIAIITVVARGTSLTI